MKFLFDKIIWTVSERNRLRVDSPRRFPTIACVSLFVALCAYGDRVCTGQTVNYSTPSSFTSISLKASERDYNEGAVRRRSSAPSSSVPSRLLQETDFTNAPEQNIRRRISHMSADGSGIRMTSAEQFSQNTNVQQATRNVNILSNARGTTHIAPGYSSPVIAFNGVQNTFDIPSAVVSAKTSPLYAQESQNVCETLADATRIALSESRTQRALALKKGASRSTVDAARSLRNPKVTNTTSYVGMLNQPATVSDLDLSGVASGLSSSIPGLAPIVSQFPTQYQIETPLTDNNFVTSVTAVSLPLYLGGRVQALTRAAEALAQATSAGEEVGEQAVKQQISEAYFLVLRTRQLRQVAIEAVQTADEHYQDAERMFNVGILTRNVVLAAQVAAAETRQNELRVANAQQLAESAYNRLLWRPLDAPVSIADVELGAPLGDLTSLTNQALQSRGELQILAAESRALQEQERVARADVLPQVAMIGAYSYFENSHLRDNSNATAAIGMTWTPIDGGTSRAKQNVARQNAMAAARLRDEAESGIRLQVRQAWLGEQEARQRVEVARIAVEQAEENLRVVTRGFQEGTVNHTETLDAATMRTTAKSNYTNARYDAILATQRLRYAVGIL